MPKAEGHTLLPTKRGPYAGVDWEGSVHADLATIWIKVAYTLPSSALASISPEPTTRKWQRSDGCG